MNTRIEGRREVLWRLEARRPSGLVGYFARFELPVGVAADPESAPEPGAEPAVHRVAGVGPWVQPREAGITCRRLEGGGLELRLAAAHRKPIGLTLAGLLFTGVAAGFLLAPAPGLMRIITVAFGSVVLLPAAFLDYIAVWLWLVSQEATVRGNSVVTRRSLGPFHWGQTFEGGDIAEVVCKIDGSSSGGNGPTMTYHGIQLQTRDGKSTWLASNLADGGYAAWLTDEINATLAENGPPNPEPSDASAESVSPALEGRLGSERPEVP